MCSFKMYIFYGTILGILLSILMVLYREERRLRLGISQGKLGRYLILKERRHYIRFKTDILVDYRTLHNATSRLRNAGAKDVSKAGLGLIINERLKPGELLEISFKVPEFERSIKAIGQVVWIKEAKNSQAEKEKKRTFSVGIKFKRIAPESEALLILYINQMKP